MPWPAWYELDGELPATVALSVPPSVLPSQIPLYIQDAARAARGTTSSITLQLLDREQYGREVQIRDFAQRVVYALTADAKRIDLPLPFTRPHAPAADEYNKQPQELLMVMRTLISTLGGATFKGKVPIAEGVEAFLFDRGGQGILVMWDRGNTAEPKQFAAEPRRPPAADRPVGQRHAAARTRDDRRDGGSDRADARRRCRCSSWTSTASSRSSAQSWRSTAR